MFRNHRDKRLETLDALPSSTVRLCAKAAKPVSKQLLLPICCVSCSFCIYTDTKPFAKSSTPIPVLLLNVVVVITRRWYSYLAPFFVRKDLTSEKGFKAITKRVSRVGSLKICVNFYAFGNRLVMHLPLDAHKKCITPGIPNGNYTAWCLCSRIAKLLSLGSQLF